MKKTDEERIAASKKRFIEATKELECEMDETEFAKTIGKLAKSKPQHTYSKSPNKN